MEIRSMSSQHGEGSAGDGEGFIRTPKQLILVVLVAFIVPIVGIVMLVMLVTGGKNIDPAGSTAKEAQMIADRLRPVGELWIAGGPPPRGAAPVAAVAAVKVEKTGEQVYQQVCAACHTTGALNAPRMGDKAAWGKLIAEGHDSLTKTSISGIRQMPARGGDPSLSDTEIRRAVAYLANAAGANFKEPPLPAPAAAAKAEPEPEPAAPAVVAAAPAAPAAGAIDGAAVYKTYCAACHAPGAAGAPKSGDKVAWAPRIKKGEDALVASVIKGLGNMPPRGGIPSLTDAQIRAAVAYQIKTNR